LVQNHFHIAVFATRISQDISPFFRATTDSASYPTRQLFRGNSLIAQVEMPVMCCHDSQWGFVKSAGQKLHVLALG
jgi:hypothetical protein